ncbi:hypothetical protein AJ79_08511 [Helicocarpus griseus UAMH5409]|uniref:Uncharacterized protein n=1 Tax=Helicocarpus griseus UAMH5409 TaxID=1447875 RepID=A0A2B7WSF0_9EURO|nr:hypothetical protein AJ79_08511 [Helicocarpus griseus UAMH5409]
MTLRDYGINIRSRLRVSRRLTCAPLQLDRFIIQDSNGTSWLMFANADPKTYEGGPARILRQRLSFPGGRARRATDGYDENFWLEGNAPDLRYWGVEFTENSDGLIVSHHPPLHPDLERFDGEIFIILYNAGRTRYHEPIEDHLYSAHYEHPVKTYWPDYEYTALGCIEKYQYCSTGAVAVCASSKMALIQRLNPSLDQETLDELEAFDELVRMNTLHYVESLGVAALLSQIFHNMEHYGHPH